MNQQERKTPEQILKESSWMVHSDPNTVFEKLIECMKAYAAQELALSKEEKKVEGELLWFWQKSGMKFIRISNGDVTLAPEFNAERFTEDKAERMIKRLNADVIKGIESGWYIQPYRDEYHIVHDGATREQFNIACDKLNGKK